MKRWLWLILPFIMAACGPASGIPRAAATPVNSQEFTQSPGSSATQLSALTAKVETVTAGQPKSNATITAILPSKYALGTDMAATTTAQPSATALPAVPSDAPFCQPGDLQGSFGSNGASQQILLSMGLKNTGPRACFLQTWPDIRLVDRQGKTLDVDYGYFDLGLEKAEAIATERAKENATAKVGLWPGWTTWINLIWQNWCAAPISGGAIIRLTFNHTGIMTIPTDMASGGTSIARGQRSTVGIAKMIVIQSR